MKKTDELIFAWSCMIMANIILRDGGTIAIILATFFLIGGIIFGIGYFTHNE